MATNLHDWPEPIVRVQSLSESGLHAIPRRYVKPPHQRPVPSPTSINIPIVDLSGGAAAAEEISAACREWGFFQVVNHGVSPALMDRIREAWREFFHLPMDMKQSREVIDEYGKQVVDLCGRVMKILSENLGLDEKCLQNAFGGTDIGACLRVNFYPKCPQPDLTLGLSSHSDPGGLTLLLPDDKVAGLQVRRGDDWITVKPAKHAFIVNIGDQVQVIIF
ncbi:Jasmonate-induced oxygenase 1 [Linum perenne]